MEIIIIKNGQFFCLMMVYAMVAEVSDGKWYRPPTLRDGVQQSTALRAKRVKK